MKVKTNRQSYCLFYLIVEYHSDFEELSDDDHQLLNRVCKLIALKSVCCSVRFES